MTSASSATVERSDRELAELVGEHAAALERLDTAAGYEAARLERPARGRARSATTRWSEPCSWRRAAAS